MSAGRWRGVVRRAVVAVCFCAGSALAQEPTRQNGPPAPEPPVDQVGPPPEPTAEREVATDAPAGGAAAQGERLIGPPLLPSAGATPVVPPALPPYQPAYRSFADAALFLGALANAAPGLARSFELGRTFDGRPVPALELAAPGPTPPGARPTVLLLGALDGRSLAGTEAVLATLHQLLTTPERLPPDVTVVAVPWAAPESLDRLAAGGVSQGASLRPLDEDQDGALDEDGADDLNDDGLILQMLIEDPDGAWTRCADGRFLVAAGPLDHPRYRLCAEGRDDDGDGRFNEDGPGGVILDRNFPVGRGEASADACAGRLPLCEPLARACADLALTRPVALALVFQGNHGGIATPGGVAATDALFEVDRAVYEQLARAFALATERAPDGPRSARAAVGSERPGCALDWFAGVVGALALEVAVWGPCVEAGADVSVRDARFQGSPAQTGARASNGRPTLDEAGRAWAAWLDDRRGGIGFDDWQPVDAGNGVTALVGGWRPRTAGDPPLESLPRALQGTPQFVVELLASLPKLELRSVESVRDGELCRVRARVANVGRLPTGVGSAWALRGPSEVALELRLPPGARLLAGEARAALPRLAASELSREASWIVLAPAGSVFEVRASAPWCAAATREVKP